MAYQPGPLLLQSAANVGVATADYNFAGDVADQLGDLDTLPGAWAPFLADAGILLQESSDPFPDVSIDAAMQTLHAYSDPATFLGIGPMVSALGDADIALGNAIGFAPAEAWTNTGAPFIAPVPTETIGIPVISPNALVFQVTGTVAGATIPAGGTPGTGTFPVVTPQNPTTPTGSTPVVTPQAPTTADATAPPTTTGRVFIPPLRTADILNLSQYGNANFRVGDEFQITATGQPGDQVAVQGTLNGTDIGGSDLGSIGSDGQLVVSGVMDESSVGLWQQRLFIAGTQVATSDHLVVPQ